MENPVLIILAVLLCLLLHGVFWEVGTKAALAFGLKDHDAKLCGFFWPATLPVLVGVLLVRVWVKTGFYRIRHAFYSLLEWFKPKPKRADQGPYRESNVG